MPAPGHRIPGTQAGEPSRTPGSELAIGRDSQDETRRAAGVGFASAEAGDFRAGCEPPPAEARPAGALDPMETQ